jgi:hypothetical protein
MAPAARRRATATASSGATKSRSASDPLVAFHPSSQITSFTAIGGQGGARRTHAPACSGVGATEHPCGGCCARRGRYADARGVERGPRGHADMARPVRATQAARCAGRDRVGHRLPSLRRRVVRHGTGAPGRRPHGRRSDALARRVELCRAGLVSPNHEDFRGHVSKNGARLAGSADWWLLTTPSDRASIANWPIDLPGGVRSRAAAKQGWRWRHQQVRRSARCGLEISVKRLSPPVRVRRAGGGRREQRHVLTRDSE